MTDNEEFGEIAGKVGVIAQYQTTRIRALWASYKRIFQLLPDSVRTLDPSSFAVTNTFPFGSINRIWPDEKLLDQFNLEINKTIFVYKTSYRAQLLCHLFECIYKYDNVKLKSIGPFMGHRIRKSGSRSEVKLICAPHGLIELDAGDRLLQEYHWVNFTRIGCDEKSSGFLFEYSGRTKVFSTPDFNALATGCKSQLRNVGLDQVPVMLNQTLSAVITYRSNAYANTGSSVALFDVNKTTKRSLRPVPRQFLISENYIVEKDASGFRFVSFQKVVNIYALVRSWTNQREFTIEFQDGSSRTYTCPMRDTLLATLLDITHAAGNIRVIVTGQVSDNLRLMPRFADEDYKASIADAFFGSNSIESWYLHRLCKACRAVPLVGESIEEACKEFNANVPCPGIAPNTDGASVKFCLIGILRHLNSCLISSANDEKMDFSRTMATLLQSLYRIIPSISGFKLLVEIKEIDARLLLLQLLRFENQFINYWALQVLTVLCKCPLTPRIVQQEFVNKHTLLTNKMFTCLLDLMSDPIEEVADETNEDSVSTLQSPENSEVVKGSDEDAAKSQGTSENSNSSPKEEKILRESISSKEEVIEKATVMPSKTSSAKQDASSNPLPLAHLSHIPIHESKVNISSISAGPEGLKRMNSNPSGEAKNSSSTFPNSLVIVGAAGLLESVVSSRRDTTSPELLSQILDVLAQRCEVLVHMMRSNAFIIIENAAILMFVLLKNRPTVSTILKEMVLSECLALKHFYLAVFSPSGAQRFISRFLVATWMSGPEKTSPGKDLLRRMIPSGLIEYLKFAAITEEHRKNLDEMEEEYFSKLSGSKSKPAPKDDADLQNRMRKRISSVLREQANAHQRPENTHSAILPHASVATGNSSTNGTQLLNLQIASNPSNPTSSNTMAPENYRVMFHMITQDHQLPDLIWNEQTRLELRSCLEAEIKDFEKEQRLRGLNRIAWNYQQFYVVFESLKEEIQVGPIYVRHFLEAGNSFIRALENPSHVVLFEKLFRRILVNIERNPILSIICTKCLCRLYEVCHDIIGAFDDMIISVRMIDQAPNMELQHCLLDLVELLSREDDNLKQLLDKEVVNILIHYASLAHLNPDQIGNVLARATNSVLLIKNSMSNDEDDESKRSYRSFQSDEDLKEFDSNSTNSLSEVQGRQKRSLWVPDDFACPRMWFIAPKGLIPPLSQSQRGPFRISELLDMIDRGSIDGHWLAAPIVVEDFDDDSFKVTVDTGLWKPIFDHFQLKLQMLCPGKAVYSPAEIASKALYVLKRISDVHRSANIQSIPFYPIPISKKVMSEPDHLTIFSQLLLANDSNVVENTAILLKNLIEYNIHANNKLYLTGAFFFICRYPGNNFLPLAELLFVSHLQQSFHDSALSVARDIPGAERSILKNILPAAMITILINYGPEKFASIFTSDCDTPEVIWNSSLRKQTVEMIDIHINNFNTKLRQFTFAKYEYVPIAKIHYPALEKEVYVHEYYLRNLCDENRFPDWPIGEPLVLLRECIERWRQEMSKGVVDNSISEAKNLLGLKAKYDNMELRKAYKNLARVYHPDKNPNGRETFEKIHKAYELLSSIENQGTETDFTNVTLLMKAQIIVYRKYPNEISVQKYPAYSLLLQVIFVPTSDCFTSAEAELLSSSVLLMYYTCNVSPLNAKEFVKSGLLEKMIEIISFALRGIDNPEIFKMASDILIYGMKTLTSISAVDSGRERLIESCPNFAELIYLVLLLERRLPLASENAIEVISRCCSSETLQNSFVNVGVIWRLIPMLLAYDSTLQDDYSNENQRSVYNQSASNMHAILAAKCLGRLGGYMFDELESPSNPPLKVALDSLLTTPLCKLLRNRRPWELLGALNENCEQTTKIWNISMRQELLDFVTKVDAERTRGFNENELDVVSSFTFKSLKGELCIGGVYCRIFCKSNDTNDIDDPSQFCKNLIAFAWRFVNPQTSKTCDISLEHQEQVVESLKVLVQANSYTIGDIANDEHGIEVVFLLLDRRSDALLFSSAVQLMAVLASSAEFITACLQKEPIFIWHLLQSACLYQGNKSYPGTSSSLWAALEGVATHHAGLDYLINSGAIAKLLGLLVGVKGYASSYQNRLSAVNLVSKFLWHPVKGSDASNYLRRFLPEPVVLLMRSKAGAASLHVLDEVCENPELIWTKDMQEELRSAIQSLLKSGNSSPDRIVGDEIDLSRDIEISADYSVVYQELSHEIYLGGVYIRLYLKQPSFRLSNPVLFLEKSIEFWENAFSIQVPAKSVTSSAHSESNAVILGNEDFLSLLTSCIICIIKGEPAVMEHILSWGFLQTLCRLLSRALTNGRRGTPVTSIIRLLHILISRPEALDDLALSNVDIVDLLTRTLDVNNTLQTSSSLLVVIPKDATVVVDLLKKIFQCNSCSHLAHFANLAKKCKLPFFLLENIIGASGQEIVKRCEVLNPSALRIHAIDLLKAICNADPEDSELKAMVDLHPSWQEFKDQSHDLFITDVEKTDIYLIEDAKGTKFAGLLTNGSETSMSQYFSSTGLPADYTIQSTNHVKREVNQEIKSSTPSSTLPVSVGNKNSIPSIPSSSNSQEQSRSTISLGSNQATLTSRVDNKNSFKTTLSKGAHGLGLDIGKTSNGGVVIQKLKEMPDKSPNPGLVCVPPIHIGDVIVGVNGQPMTQFADIVAAIRSSSSSVELWIERL